MKARGNTKAILEKVGEIQGIIGTAQSFIDTSEQHKIRAALEEAHRLCIEIRDLYDPL